MYEASVRVDLHQLPKLFCGFHKRADSSGPTLYPVACSPQAWATGSVFLLFRAVLGINIRARERIIRFCNPTLPPHLNEVTIENPASCGCFSRLADPPASGRDRGGSASAGRECGSRKSRLIVFDL